MSISPRRTTSYGPNFRTAFRSYLEGALPDGFAGARAASTGIYYLLEPGDFSAFHRIRSDEMWHFYDGGALHVEVIHADGAHETLRLGRDPEAGEVLQAVVPAGAWFGSAPAGDNYSLVGCTVAPGFDFRDFEMAERTVLRARFPQHAALVERLTRG